MTTLSSLKARLKGTLSLFARSESGMTLPLLAISLLAITGFTGLAIDVGRVQMVQSRLQFAIDSAGLAAGATVTTASTEAEFKKYMDVNFNNYMGATLTGYSVQANETNTVFNMSATATVPTTFIGILGINTVSLNATSEITRAITGLELVLVLDNTGSMTSSAGGSVSKLNALKSASNTLIGTLFGAAPVSTNDKLWVGIVPFSQAVNIGTSRTSWLNTNYVYDSTSDTMATLDWGTGNNGIGWGGCVDSRLNGYDITDAPPTSGDTLFGQYYWTSDNLNTNSWVTGSNDWKLPLYDRCQRDYRRCRISTGVCTTVVGSCSTSGGRYTCTALSTTTCSEVSSCSTPYVTCTPSGNYTYVSPLNTTYRGPNLYCPQEVTPLTNDSSVLTPAIDGMVAVGNTEISEGLAWGWRMLSPRWQGLWGGLMNAKGLPLAYDARGMAKAVVLLTDGKNTISNGVHGSYWHTGSNRLGGMSLDQKTLALCTAMKSAGIYIYTIGLGPSYDINATLLRNCATADNYYFYSPTTAELQSVFDAIGDSLSNLRVSR